MIETMRPHTGRYLAEDEVLINLADAIRGMPINIARGMKPGAMRFGGYGERAALGAETNQPIVPNGMTVIPHPTGVQMSVVSTDANDTAAGTGAQQVEIHYIDGAGDLNAETVTMNGTTPVLTAATDIRFLQCMHIHKTGGATSVVGEITATNGGLIYSVILAGEIRCSSSFRMVPNGKVLFIASGIVSSASTTADANTRIRMVASELDDHQYSDPQILIPFATFGVVNGSESFVFPTPEMYHAGTVVGATQSTNKAATIGVTWFGWLENAA